MTDDDFFGSTSFGSHQAGTFRVVPSWLFNESRIPGVAIRIFGHLLDRATCVMTIAKLELGMIRTRPAYNSERICIGIEIKVEGNADCPLPGGM